MDIMYRFLTGVETHECTYNNQLNLCNCNKHSCDVAILSSTVKTEDVQFTRDWKGEISVDQW